MPITGVEPVDISNAGSWRASDEARSVTRVALAVGGGSCGNVGATALVLPG
jgi:hypothetical protein